MGIDPGDGDTMGRGRIRAGHRCPETRLRVVVGTRPDDSQERPRKVIDMNGDDRTGASGGAVRHVVMFRWRDGVTDADVEALRRALSALPAAVGTIVAYDFGADLGINEGNADFVVVADFASREDYLVYRDHPEHRRVIAELILPVITDRVAVQVAL